MGEGPGVRVRRGAALALTLMLVASPLLWFFFLNLEGKEADWNYVSPCGCEVAFVIEVKAVKGDDA